MHNSKCQAKFNWKNYKKWQLTKIGHKECTTQSVKPNVFEKTVKTSIDKIRHEEFTT